MAHCPNENSKEWKDLLELNEGNEEMTWNQWQQFGYSDIGEFPELNTEVAPNEEVQEAAKVIKEVNEEEKSDETPMQKLMDKTLLNLRGRISVLQRQKNPKKASIKKLKELVEQMEDTEEVQSLLLFINNAYNTTVSMKAAMQRLLKNLKNPESDRKELLNLMAGLNEFAFGYNVLDEINTTDIIDYFSVSEEEAKEIFEKTEDGKSELSTEQKLKEAISIRDTIKLKILQEAIPLLADFLLDARSVYAEGNIEENVEALQAQARNLIERAAETKSARTKRKIKKDLEVIQENLRRSVGKTVTREDMIKTLQEAAVEEGPFEYWIGPLISSPDSAIALFAKAVKDKMEGARMLDIIEKRSIAESFQNYLDVVQPSRDNPKKFNEGIYEVIKVPVLETVKSEFDDNRTYQKTKLDKDGKPMYRDEIRFVAKYDKNKRNERYAEWEAANPKPHKGKAWSTLTKEERAEVNAWKKRKKKEVTDQIYVLRDKSEIEQIKKAKKDELESGRISEAEYQIWQKEEMPREIRKLSDEFLNEKWLAMYNKDGTAKNAMGEYHKALTDLYYKAQEKIPANLRPGDRVPSVNKKDLERLKDEGIVDLITTKIKEAGRVQSYDIEMRLQGAAGTAAKFLPIWYVQPIKETDLSYDFASTVLLFSQMANKFEAMDSIHAETSLMQTVIGARKVPEFTRKGKKVVDAFAKRFGYKNFIEKTGESYSKKHLDAFIEMIVYGEMQKAEDLGFANLSATKVTNTITGLSAITSIAADLLKGVANNFQGNIQLAIEASSGQYFNYKDFVKGKISYAKYLPGMIGDFGKPTPTSFMGMLGEMYDPIQGNFTDKYGRLVTASVANKIIRVDTLFFNQYFGEHEIQYSGMLSVMNRTKVRDKETQEEISLFDAYEKYGVEKAHDNIEFIQEDKEGNKTYTPFTEKERRSIQDRIHALSKKMHGIYNSFDKGVAQRHSLGRLGLMYRKHMYPGFKRRYQKFAWDEELGDTVEGYYRTFWYTFMRDLRLYHVNIAKQWSTYSTTQKANIYRFTGELARIMSLVGLIAIFSKLGDDDEELKKSYSYNFLLYEMIRMRSETAQYLNPKDLYRTIKSPSAALSTTSRVFRFANQILPWNITEQYERKSGIWNKGDNKAYAYFIKMIGLPGYNIDPREAVKIYESITAI